MRLFKMLSMKGPPMALHEFTIAVRHDDIEKNCFMVVITFEDGSIRIPLRGVSKREATEALKPLKYAFDYGLEAGLGLLHGVRASIEESP